eukprot:3930073-Pleurochrysis_carterae.AAC.4
MACNSIWSRLRMSAHVCVRACVCVRVCVRVRVRVRACACVCVRVCVRASVGDRGEPENGEQQRPRPNRLFFAIEQQLSAVRAQTSRGRVAAVDG